MAPALSTQSTASHPVPGLVGRVKGTGGSSHQPTLTASPTSPASLSLAWGPGSWSLESGVPPSGKSMKFNLSATFWKN